MDMGNIFLTARQILRQDEVEGRGHKLLATEYDFIKLHGQWECSPLPEHSLQ